MSEVVHICEVGPRDGLQNEPRLLGLASKLEMVAALRHAGLAQIELGSFVSPKAVPAMADTDELAMAVRRLGDRGLRTLGLVMNDKGFERAAAAGVDGVCIVTVVSPTLCQKNNRVTPEEATRIACELLKKAKARGLFTRVDIATSWVCPFEGPIAPETVMAHADRLWEYQPDEMALCDSIGGAQPYEVARLFEAFGARYERERLVAHFHDTEGLGLANVTAALFQGIRRFDASIGGLGGCPFAPGAKGNLATEDLVHLCDKLGFHTGVKLDSLWQAVTLLEGKMGRPLGGQTKAWFHSRTGSVS